MTNAEIENFADNLNETERMKLLAYLVLILPDDKILEVFREMLSEFAVDWIRDWYLNPTERVNPTEDKQAYQTFILRLDEAVNQHKD